MCNVRAIVSAFILLTVLLTSNLETKAQIWTTATGTYSVEAEFLKLEDGVVHLRRLDDNRVIKVELNKLSDANRQKAQILHRKQTEAAVLEELLKSIKVSVEVDSTGVSNMPSFDDNFPRDRYFKLSLIARGKPTKTVFKIGKLQLDTLVVNSAKEPEKWEEAEYKDSMGDRYFDSFGRIQSTKLFQTHVHPRGGVFIKFMWQGALPLEIRDFTGSFNLVLGGERAKIRVEDLSKFLGLEIEHQSLRAAGLSVKLVELYELNKHGKIIRCQPKFVVEGNIEDLVSLDIRDRRGKEMEAIRGSSYSSQRSTAKFSFKFRTSELPADAVLYIETVKNPIELEVPFEFHSLVPSRKSRKFERKQTKK